MSGQNREHSKRGGFFPKVSIWILVLTNLLVFQLSGIYFQESTQKTQLRNEQDMTNVMNLPSSSSLSAIMTANPLEIPLGEGVALPSIQIDDSNVEYKRISRKTNYGGKGDKPHLGGFTSDSVDMDGVSPNLWTYMVKEVGIKSLLDVGCGRGISTSWFHLHGVKTSCVEGSHDAITQTVLPRDIITEHDFSRGPWWPAQTVDAIWCVELLEHVGRNFHQNLLPAFRKAALIYATHSTWGGWHHVEVHMADWWIQKFESYGFKYSKELSEAARNKAREGKNAVAPNGKNYESQHIWLHMMVFINPIVASLPEHHHLFAEGGCFDKHENINGKRTIVHRKCGTGSKELEEVETVLPNEFLPLELNESMDKDWENLIFGKGGEGKNEVGEKEGEK